MRDGLSYRDLGLRRSPLYRRSMVSIGELKWLQLYWKL